MKRLLPIALIAILAACSSASSGSPTTTASASHLSTETPTATSTAAATLKPTPTFVIFSATPKITVEPTAKPTPVNYKKLKARDWQKLVKAPDDYIGNAYQLWGCISQFDAATGEDAFRAQTSYRNETYWFSEGENALFNGDADQLTDFVKDDVVVMSVIVLGSFSYDTQAGGNTTVPLFEVDKISRKGSC